MHCYVAVLSKVLPKCVQIHRSKRIKKEISKTVFKKRESMGLLTTVQNLAGYQNCPPQNSTYIFQEKIKLHL